MHHQQRWSVISSQRWLHIREGRLAIEGSGRHSRVGPGGIIVVPFGVRHRMRVIGPNAVKMDLLRVRKRSLAQGHAIDRQAMQLALHAGHYAFSHNFRLRMPAAHRSRVQNSLTRLREIADADLPGKSLQLKGEFLSLLGEIATVSVIQKFVPPNDPQDTAGSIRRVLAYIDEHADEPLAINEAAAIAGLARTRFIAAFKRTSGMTFAAYVTKVRLGRVAHDLKHSRRGILDIAYGNGFGSISRFYEAFKNEFGVSPAQYRRKA